MKVKNKVIDFANAMANTMVEYRKESISHCGLSCAVILAMARRAGIKAQVASCFIIEPQREILDNGHHFIILEDTYAFDLTLNQFFPRANVWPVLWELDCGAVKDIYGKYKIMKPSFEKKLLQSITDDGRDDIFMRFIARGVNLVEPKNRKVLAK